MLNVYYMHSYFNVMAMPYELMGVAEWLK